MCPDGSPTRRSTGDGNGIASPTFGVPVGNDVQRVRPSVGVGPFRRVPVGVRHLNNVSIIKGYAELLLDREQGDRSPEIEIIHRQSEEMAKVITDVRVLLESLQGVYRLEERDLSPVVRDEFANVRTMTEEPIEIEATVPDEVAVLADDLLPRVFRSLFSNAGSHNESPNPRLSVTVEESAETVTVRVADNGPGIPASKQPSLFERSQNADHGLGLYLVDELVERYDGATELVETGPAGTVFCVTLNRIAAAATDGDADRVPATAV